MGTPADPWIAGDHPVVVFVVLLIFIIGFVWAMTEWASRR
jgi:hypothetical protein